MWWAAYIKILNQSYFLLFTPSWWCPISFWCQFNVYVVLLSILIIVQIAISYLWKQLVSKIFSINFQQNVRSKTPSLKSLYEKKGVHELSNFSCFLCSIVSYWKSWTLTRCSKGGFFSESEIRFSNLPISQKIYSKKLSWAWNLKFPPKQLIQISSSG